MSQKVLIPSLFEFALVAAGWILIWRLQFSARAKNQRPEQELPFWGVSSHGFTLAALCVFFGWISAQILASYLPRIFPALKSDDTLMVIFGGSLGQACLIAGVGAAAFFLRKTEPFPAASRTRVSGADGYKSGLFLTGLATCIITISVVYPAEFAWEKILTWCNLPTDKQEMVELFFRTASPLRILGLTVMAVILAPIGEELVFRAGLFRYLRGRAPRWAALLLPALFFASLHVDRTTMKGLVSVVPLIGLGVVFSLAYERTGRIAVPIIAHALFNLHTVVLILLGVND